jgi:hypothetical protein
MILGRMVYYYLPAQKLFHIPATRFSRYFVWLDVISFFVQLIGASIVSGTNVAPKTMQLGLHIYMGGIGMQQFFICIFAGLAVVFHREMLAVQRSGMVAKPGWKRLLYTLYVSLVLITVSRFDLFGVELMNAKRLIQIRVIYRLVEYSRGTDPSNPIPTHEAYFYCLESAPMWIAITIMNFTHPGHVLVGPDSEFPKLSRKQKKAAKKAAKAEKAAKKSGKLLDPEAGFQYSGIELGADISREGSPVPMAHGGYAHQGYGNQMGRPVYN